MDKMNKDDRVNVLLAEHDARLLMRMEMIAREEDLLVTTCKDGLEALKIARKERPNLMVVDVGIPGLNAFTLCRLIKFDGRLKDMKIVLLANVASREYEDKAERVGIEEVVVKPFSDAELLNLIQMGVGRCRLRQQKVIWLEKK